MDKKQRSKKISERAAGSKKLSIPKELMNLKNHKFWGVGGFKPGYGDK